MKRGLTWQSIILFRNLGGGERKHFSLLNRIRTNIADTNSTIQKQVVAVRIYAFVTQSTRGY